MEPRIIVRYGPGPAFAALASGSIFCVALALGIYCQNIPAALPVETDAAAPVAAWLGLATLFGTIIALIPCLIGSEVMAQLGRHLPFTRLPPIWALAGMLPIGAGAFVVGVKADGFPVLFAFLATGAACALICRRFAEWHEEIPEQMNSASIHHRGDDPRLLR